MKEQLAAESKAACFHSFVVALWGSCAGFLVVALLVIPLLFQDINSPTGLNKELAEVASVGDVGVPWESLMQKRMFALNSFVCSLFALGSLLWRRRLNGWLCFTAIVLFVPFVSMVYGDAYRHHLAKVAFFLALTAVLIPLMPSWRQLSLKYLIALAVLPPLAFWAYGRACGMRVPKSSVGVAVLLLLAPGMPWSRWFPRAAGWCADFWDRCQRLLPKLKPRQPSADAADLAVSVPLTDHGQRFWRWDSPRFRFVALAVLLQCLVILFLFPRNVAKYAAEWRTETHICSYCVAPALAMLAPDHVPGLDFESHYGVGHVYVFSFMLGDTLNDTLARWIWLFLAVLSFYFLSAYVVCNQVFRSAATAFFIALMLLVTSMDGLSFRGPSNFPVRYPLIFVMIGFAWREEVLGRRWLPAVCAGITAGLSFFWQTDIGIYMSLGGLAYYGALCIRERQGWLRGPLFLLCNIATMSLLCLAIFGPRTLSLEFYRRLLDPLLAYSEGFGYVAMYWGFGWSYFYNVISPVVLAATAGWSFWYMSHGDSRRRSDARFLFLNAAIAVPMLFKWANRAIDPIWTINAACALVVMYYWLRFAAVLLSERLETNIGASVQWLRGRRAQLATGMAVCLLLITGAVVSYFYHNPNAAGGCSSSPMRRILFFTQHTPTMTNWALERITRVKDHRVMPPGVAPADVELIAANTRTTEPVTLLAHHDWAYLAEARRAPAFPFLPLYATYSKRLMAKLEPTMARANRVFVESGFLAELKDSNHQAYHCVVPLLSRDFTLVATGKAIDMYERTRATYPDSADASMAPSLIKKDFFFKDGDRVVFMGDSITNQSLYSSYLETWTVTRFPGWKLTFRNVGLGGDQSPVGEARFQQDVVAHGATALTVDFGMNDGGVSPFNDKRFAKFMAGLEGIAKQARSANIRVAWLTPQAVERGCEEDGYNITLEKFSTGVKKTADMNDGLFVDQFHPYYSLIKKARAQDPHLVNIMGGDPIHPGPNGHAVMASLILKRMNFPRLVTSMDISIAENRKDMEAVAVNCEAFKLTALPEGGLTIKRKDLSFPFFPDEASGILKWAPVLEDMNHCILKVNGPGLIDGEWDIFVGDHHAGRCSSSQLRSGVNLAAPLLEAGPIADCVKKVAAAVKHRNDYFGTEIFQVVHFRDYRLPLFKDLPREDQDRAQRSHCEERMKKMPELDAAIHQALREALETEYTITVKPASMHRTVSGSSASPVFQEPGQQPR